MNGMIYLYGMVMSTDSFVLCGDFPKSNWKILHKPAL